MKVSVEAGQLHTALKGAIPLGVFMVDLVAACVVGDPREEVVRLATPPKLREAAVGTSGLPAADPYEGFAVRRYLTVTVDTNPNPSRG